MDAISSETGDENGCRERPLRMRRSSILKPPRSPLQDIKGVNERVQESGAFRNKKNSRRVSFADTIKVFQAESHIKFERKSENAETEVGENVPFVQNKNLDGNNCEITGMDTLLCAPIQAQMQHREISITELNHERKYENDQTVIFSDENQMDLTASHTVMINNDLLDCTRRQKSSKIDTTSFLTNLQLRTEDSRMKNELKFSMDQSSSSENKLSFSDFIKNLKIEKSNDFPSIFSSNKENYFSPDKENSEMHMHSKNSRMTSTMYHKHASLNVEENSTNVTRIFREQDDGMNFTQCHTVNIQTLAPSSSEARLREFKCDTTIYDNDLMDLTVNHNIQILPSVDNLSKSEIHTKDVAMDGTMNRETSVPEKKTVFKNELNDALRPGYKTEISRSHIIGTEIDPVTRSSNQETRPLAMNSESTLSSPGRQDYKTILYSSCNDAMELTKCVSSIKEKKNLLNHDSNFSNIYPNPDAISLFIDKTIYSGETSMDMDITKSNTVAIDNQIFKQDQTSVEMAAIPVSEKEMTEKSLNISENGEMIVNCSSVSRVSEERLQQSLENPLSILLIDKKTEIFVNEDMDLTESHTTNLGCQPPLTSSNPAPENTCKHHSHSKSPSDEWALLSGQSLKNLNTTVNSHTLKSIPDQNSKLPEPPRKSLGNPIPDYSHNKTIVCSEEKENMDLTKSHTVAIGFVPSEVQKLGKTNLESNNSQLSTVNRQIVAGVEKCTNDSIEKNGVFIANDTDVLAVKSIQKPELLSEKKDVKTCKRKSGRLKVDKTIIFSEVDENDMDITKSYTVETNHRPFLEHDSCLMPLAGTSKTVLYTCEQDDMEITRSHTTILQCKALSPDKITSRPIDRTVIFEDNHDELEMTKSHTVFNDYHAKEKTVLSDGANWELYKKKSLEEAEVASIPAEECVFFPKNDGGVRSAAKGSRLTPAGEWANTDSVHKAVELKGDGSMGVSKSNIWENDHNKQKPGLLNEPPLGKSQKRKSLRLQNDKTIEFSKNDNDTDIHQSCMTETNNESALKDGECSHLLPMAGTSKTILYSCGQDDMEITRSHTTALECKTLSPDKKNAMPVNNTVMFVDNQSALEVTKSHTVFIDYQSTKDSLQKGPEFGIAKRKALDISFPAHGSSVQDATKQADPRESKVVLHSAQKHEVIPFVPTNALSGSQGETEVSKFQSTAMKEEAMGKVVDQANILEKSKIECCQLSSTNTHRHETALLRSVDNHACLPNVSSFNNLHGKDQSFCDDLTKQLTQTHANPREKSDSMTSCNVKSFSDVKPNLNDLNEAGVKTVPVSCSPEQLLELVDKVHVRATEMPNTSTGTNRVNDDGDEGNETSHDAAKTNPVPRTVRKDKVKRYSLGIFLPRLPNKRNCNVTCLNGTDQTPAGAADSQPTPGKNSDTGFVATNLNLSPSQYIDEENLPTDLGEINSLDSISLEMDEKALAETCQKEISSSGNKMEANCNGQKRAWVQGDDDTQNEQKVKKRDIRVSDSAPDQEISSHHTEGNIDKTTNSTSRTLSSCSSSLDSIKADGTSLDFSTHRNSQMESQFLADTICEESLKEKLKDGRITLKEFFILLQVHILIQKPRQSNLPAKFTINSPATPEDLMLSQYVYRPKIQVYREDCDALHQKIEGLKLSALNQDKLLTDVNKNLWEKMKHSSDEELKAFGNYLNKIKSRFTKMTKVFTHQGKVALYSKLVESAQNERKKLQIRIDKMENTLKKIDNCLAELEIETKDLNYEEKDDIVKEWDSEMKAAEKELEQLKTKEEELQRNFSELEAQKGQLLDQIDLIQKQTSKANELLDQLSLSEWDIIEWSDDQAVFTFLYNTIELNIIFGEIEVGLPFLDKSYRKIIDLNFQSLLDENEAPPSSLLVNKLIFQYIEEQGSWKKKCTTQHHVPKMLHEISTIVSHCKLLGEEIEFLKSWGPNYNLMSIDVNNTELKLLFSSSAAFAKFEITLCLSAGYPCVPLPFTFQNHIGNIGKDKITAIFSKVPLEDNYLKNVVKHIYQDLLQE